MDIQSVLGDIESWKEHHFQHFGGKKIWKKSKFIIFLESINVHMSCMEQPTGPESREKEAPTG